jgi:hypothetical protein
VTVAVNVTLVPAVAGFEDDESAVVDDCVEVRTLCVNDWAEPATSLLPE